MTVTDTRITIKFGDLLKQTRPGYELPDITINAYAPEPRLCPCISLQEYLKRTLSLRSDDLFISWAKPHKFVTANTISRWLKLTLARAGIDVKVFTAYRMRSGASSAAAEAGVSIGTILKTAGWSNSSTFCKYYRKQVEKPLDMGTAILDTS